MTLSKKGYLDKLEKSRSLPVIVKDQDKGEDYICDFEQTDVFDSFNQLIKDVFDPQPYGFEELHKGMWVWCHWFKESIKEARPVKVLGVYRDRDGNNPRVKCQIGDSIGMYGFGSFIFYPLTKGIEPIQPIEITRFEYTLLQVWSERYRSEDRRLRDFDWVIGLRENGYLRDIDLNLTFKEALDKTGIKDE